MADPVWERPALLILLTCTTLLYTWGLDRNGWANSFYSAAAMSGSLDWTAFLFGSSDPNNAISVDKPPLSLWVMSLSVRLFGLNSWSLLLPQALMGVISVYLLYRMVRKRFDAATSLLSGTFLAVIPVATVMFRYNNPDALLTLLMIGIVYLTLEAVDSSRIRWLLLAGVLTGAAFLTKQLQVLLVFPSVGLTYLVFARDLGGQTVPAPVGCTRGGLLAGGWWLLAVQLTSPANRPFIGGSRNNSVIELTLGYNGLDRLTGEDASRTMSVDALDDGQTGRGLPALPSAAVLRARRLVSSTGGCGTMPGRLVSGRRQGRPAARALLLACCVWFACAATVLAFMSGIVHSYYVLTAVPPLCFLAALALLHFLRGLQRVRIRILTGLTMIASMIFAFISVSFDGGIPVASSRHALHVGTSPRGGPGSATQPRSGKDDGAPTHRHFVHRPRHLVPEYSSEPP